MLATQVGVQRISGITVHAVQEKKVYDSLVDIEVCLFQILDLYRSLEYAGNTSWHEEQLLIFMLLFCRFLLMLSEILGYRFFVHRFMHMGSLGGDIIKCWDNVLLVMNFVATCITVWLKLISHCYCVSASIKIIYVFPF
jgi:hypothetical protein